MKIVKTSLNLFKFERNLQNVSNILWNYQIVRSPTVPILFTIPQIKVTQNFLSILFILPIHADLWRISIKIHQRTARAGSSASVFRICRILTVTTKTGRQWVPVVIILSVIIREWITPEKIEENSAKKQKMCQICKWVKISSFSLPVRLIFASLSVKLTVNFRSSLSIFTVQDNNC